MLTDEKIAKDSVRKLTIATIEDPTEEVDIIAENNNLTLLNSEDVEKIISEIVINNENMVKERQMGAMGPLMGMAMKELKGKADGSVVNQLVREEIQKLI